MKGPGLRNDLEIRRTFRCPQCGRTVLKLGDVVSVACTCAEPPVWMLIQPDPQKKQFHFEKVEIPLTAEDLVVRERPRRMPSPPPEGQVPEVTDRRPQRPKRPKPERRSFEEFQEVLAAQVESEVPDQAKMTQSKLTAVTTEVTTEITTEVTTEVTVVEKSEVTIIEKMVSPARAETASPAAPAPAAPAPASPAPAPPPADEFGEGL